MLNRKSGPGLLSAAGSIDRGRVGERLQAALAGLQELHLLKEKQGDMVHWALRMNHEDPLSSVQQDADGPVIGTEEQRLEATLAALKQQLMRLRRQDVGLKSHLQQLDQQISELKLDVSKASSEHLESDSRPSSGFYELSDGGSGSLSNSCTSVYSECLSSSQSSLFPTPCSPGLLTLPAGRAAEAARPRSADESTSRGEPPRVSGVRQPGSRIRTGVADRARPRPVSTGDLERLVTPSLGLYKSIELKKTSLCVNLQQTAVNPKYRSDLLSRSGAEVYRYPSPLHAVALQSPMFSLNGNEVNISAETLESQDGGTPSAESPEGDERSESKSVGYINKILQCSLSKGNLLVPQLPVKSQNEAPAVGNRASAVKDQNSWMPYMGPQELPLEAEKTLTSQRNQLSGDGSSSGLNQVENISTSYCQLYPADVHEPKTRAVATISGMPRDGKEGSGEHPHQELSSKDGEMARSAKTPSVTRTSSVKERRDPEGTVHTTQPEFVHAQFVPAGSRRVKVRQADRKTKAVKLRRRSSERPRSAKQQQQPQVYCDREKEPNGRGARHTDRGPKQAGEGRMSRDPPTRMGDGGTRLYSESNSMPHFTCLQPQMEPNARVKNNPRIQHPNLERMSADPSRKKQVARKWQLVAETGPWPASLSVAQGQRSREVPGTSRKTGLVRNVRPRSGPWVGPPRSLHPSSSYLGSYAFRYPAASHYPPASESGQSEYSADGASLFHSTIAESSEGELSDFTTNRFGDSESSQGSQSPGDSDSSISLEYDEEEEDEEGGLVWAEAAVGPTTASASMRQSCPEPPAFRIKASRALKKKIRRFQPASLKVMTLV
uniref:Dishevelled-binding antagonist of beta-catenin 2 n=1 Tax=Paramormyrops kingsleyae TaxID=1676925 RepID=A0A3B3TA04_9TELE|nr:dapper homolog 2 [Paramormyrops kingsleyae]